MIKIDTNAHNGVDYTIIKEDSRHATGSITRGSKKWTLKGLPNIEITKGSYKHGDEVQIVLWNKAGETIEQERVKYATKYDRVEIFFSVDLWHELIKGYVQAIKQSSSDNL